MDVPTQRREASMRNTWRGFAATVFIAPGRSPAAINDGASPSGKAPGFDPDIRRFESCRPSHQAECE